jgi:hypothetical protein
VLSLRLVNIRDRGGCLAVSTRAEKAAPAPSSSHRRRGSGDEAITRRRVLKALHALPLQALHLAYEAGPFATYDVPAWAPRQGSTI